MSKATRDRSARERMAQERAARAARQKRLRGLLISGVAVVVVAVAVVAGILVANHKSGGDGWDSYAGPYAPVTEQADGSYLMAKAGASAPKLDVYEDLQCPYCKEFEKANGGSVQQLAYQGKVQVVYHIMAFVNPTGSLRAAVAASCAYDVKAFAQFHNVAYREQPDETEALTTAKLKDFGRQAGITNASFDGCVDAQATASRQQGITKAAESFLEKNASSGGSWGTPTVLINGKQYSGNAVFNKGALAPVLTKASPVPAAK